MKCKKCGSQSDVYGGKIDFISLVMHNGISNTKAHLIISLSNIENTSRRTRDP